MKKVLIVLLSVLLALSFVSCESDKSEEIISTYVEYIEGEKFCYSVYDSLSELYTTKKDNGSYSLAKETTIFKDTTIENTSYISNLVKAVSDINECEIKSATAKSGKITCESENPDSTSYKREVSYDSVIVDVVYTDSSEDEQSISLSINGKYSYMNTWEKDTYKTLSGTKSHDITVNNKTYKIELSYNSEKTTSAKVNGKSVDLRLINAGR